MKQFKVAKTIIHNVWAEDEEEARTMFESFYRAFLSNKKGISIFSDELDNIEKPWNWKEVEVGDTKKVEFSFECPEGEPCTKTKIVKAIKERDETVIQEIKEYLEEFFPLENKNDDTWKWDTHAGHFRLLACEFGDNYDERKEPVIDDPQLARLVKECPEYFYILKCNECCRCQ